MLKGFAVLLLFQWLGEITAHVTGSPVPGPVIGMLFLWLTLAIKGGPSKPLEEVSSGLIKHLSLFFLPAGVGLFFLPEELHQYWPALLGAMIVGTVASMFLTGGILKSLTRKSSP